MTKDSKTRVTEIEIIDAKSIFPWLGTSLKNRDKKPEKIPQIKATLPLTCLTIIAIKTGTITNPMLLEIAVFR